MFILTQDGNEIINFDKVVRAWAAENGNIVAIIDGNPHQKVLGTFPTKDDAKDELARIVGAVNGGKNFCQIGTQEGYNG